LEKKGRTSKIGLHDMQMHHISTNDEENLSIAKFVNGAGLLNSDNILHGGHQVEKDNHVPNDDLIDARTSPATPGEAMATKEHHVVENNVLSTYPASPLYNQCYVQSGENRAPAHCNVLPSAPVLGVGSINMYDPPRTGLQKVSAHPVAQP
jgi:hypothetical protein